MRGALPIGLLLLAFASGCWGSPPPAEAPSRPAAPPATMGGVPSWAPALTPQQKALLQPVDRAIKARAERVFPDLSRFGYAPSRPLADAQDAVKFARMVTQVLNDSPRFYTLGEAPAEAANLVAQYGPSAGEPDGFSVVKRGEGGFGELVPAAGVEAARAALSKGDELAQGGDLAGAIAAYRDGIGKSPGVPALRVALAGALRKLARTSEAEAQYKEALGVDPTFAPAHLGLAEIADQRNDIAAARRALVEALAYDPPSKGGLELAKKLGGGEDGGWTDAPAAKSSGRVAPFAIFLDVDEVGAVHVATAKSDAAQIYGGCRAVMRHEPDLREQLFQQPRETPYYLSVAEEVVCLEASIGAYLVGRTQGQPPSPDLEELFRIAREDGLSGYVMFEILGQHRPERARAAPPDAHREVARYVEQHVLARRYALPEGKYTATR